MKKSVLIMLLIAGIATYAQAQQKNYIAILTSLLKNADTDFKNIKGKQIGKDKNATYYESKLKLGIGTEEIKVRVNNEISYYVYVEYAKARELEKAVDEFIDTYFDKTKFDLEDEDGEKDDEYNLDIFAKDNAFPMMTVAAVWDEQTKTMGYGIIIYAKSSRR